MATGHTGDAYRTGSCKLILLEVMSREEAKGGIACNTGRWALWMALPDVTHLP